VSQWHHTSDTEHDDIHHNGIQHDDIQHDDIQHDDTQHNDIQHNDILHNDTHHKGTICDTHYNTTMNVVMLSVAAAGAFLKTLLFYYFNKRCSLLQNLTYLKMNFNCAAHIGTYALK
jgi:hypothetical protein